MGKIKAFIFRACRIGVCRMDILTLRFDSRYEGSILGTNSPPFLLKTFRMDLSVCVLTREYRTRGNSSCWMPSGAKSYFPDRSCSVLAFAIRCYKLSLLHGLYQWNTNLAGVPMETLWTRNHVLGHRRYRGARVPSCWRDIQYCLVKMVLFFDDVIFYIRCIIS